MNTIKTKFVQLFKKWRQNRIYDLEYFNACTVDHLLFLL